MDTKWTDAIVADFGEWLKTHSIDDYTHVDWSRKEDPERKSPGEEETLLG
jgi:hypothetical protein